MTKLSDLEFISFGEGIERIKKAISAKDVKIASEPGAPVVTSLDADSKAVAQELEVPGLPSGFDKWQLPVYFEGEGAQFFVTVVAADTSADEHAHNNGHALRIVVSGSIHHGGKKLKAGDWMFVPKGTKYAFKAGRQGATLSYCYPCCCVPRKRAE